MSTVRRTDGARSTPKISSEILDRQPPQSLEAEKGVLGSILIDPQLCDDVALILRPDDFYADAHRKLYTHMLAMHDEGSRIDTTLLLERLKRAGEFEAIGGMAYLAEVAQSVPVAAHATYYAQIVREKGTLRELIHASTEILATAWDPTLDPREVLNQAEEKIFAVHDQRGSGQVSGINEVLMEAFEHIDARLEHGVALGVPSGFTDLDELTGGLHDSELVILAARPSVGKTSLAVNIAEHASIESKVTTLIVSLEMARLELAQRMLCSQGRIDAHKFRKGRISSEDRKKLVEASARLSMAPLFIDDSPSRTVTEIAATARRLKRKEKLGLIVIDYMQLIEPENARDPRQEQVAKIARRLKGLARELNVPVLCLAQLNRQAELGKEGPKLSHLRESGAIEQDADVVLFLHREEPDNPGGEGSPADAAPTTQIIIAKQRNGPVGKVEVTWLGKYTRFENKANRPFDEFGQFDGQTF